MLSRNLEIDRKIVQDAGSDAGFVRAICTCIQKLGTGIRLLLLLRRDLFRGWTYLLERGGCPRFKAFPDQLLQPATQVAVHLQPQLGFCRVKERGGHGYGRTNRPLVESFARHTIIQASEDALEAGARDNGWCRSRQSGGVGMMRRLG